LDEPLDITGLSAEKFDFGIDATKMQHSPPALAPPVEYSVFLDCPAILAEKQKRAMRGATRRHARMLI
jgi:hypothetical protein